MVQLLTEAEKVAARYAQLASVFQRADRVLAERDVFVSTTNTYTAIPAYSDGVNITINTMALPPTIDMNAIMTMTGLNFHELAHVMYTPRPHQPGCSELKRIHRDSNCRQAFNVLEDQRIESMLVGLYPSVAAYFVRAVMKYILADRTNWATVFPLLHGRRYIPAQIRSAFEARYRVPEDIDALKQIIDEYRGLVMPRDIKRGIALIYDFLALLKHVGRVPPDPFGHTSHNHDVDAGQSDSTKQQKEAQEWASYRDEEGYDDDNDDEAARQLAGLSNDEDEDEDGNDDRGKSHDADADSEGDDEEDEEGDSDGGDAGGDSGSNGSDQGMEGDKQRSVGRSDAGSADSGDDDSGDSPSTGMGRSDGGSDSEGGQGNTSEDTDDVGGASGSGASAGKAKAPHQMSTEDLAKLLRQQQQMAEQDQNVQRDIAEKQRHAQLKPESIHTGLSKAPGQPCPATSLIAARNKVTAELRRIADDQDPGWRTHQSSGRLNIQRVMRDNDPESVFDRWDEGVQTTTDIEAVLLLDMSISMGSMIDVASMATWVLKSALEKIGAKVTCLGYSDSSFSLYERDTKANKTEWLLFSTYGGTKPYTALQVARRIFGLSTRTHKVLVSLTDGAWTGGENNTDIIDLLNHAGVHTGMVYLSRMGKTSRRVDKAAYEAYGQHHQTFAQIGNPMELVTFTKELVATIMKGGMR